MQRFLSAAYRATLPKPFNFFYTSPQFCAPQTTSTKVREGGYKHKAGSWETLNLVAQESPWMAGSHGWYWQDPLQTRYSTAQHNSSLTGLILQDRELRMEQIPCRCLERENLPNSKWSLASYVKRQIAWQDKSSTKSNTVVMTSPQQVFYPGILYLAYFKYLLQMRQILSQK